MKITGEELYKIWCAWPIREDVVEVPFVIKYETWYGTERHLLVRKIARLAHDDSGFEVKCYNDKFRPVTRCINKKTEFKLIEDGLFEAIDWS